MNGMKNVKMFETLRIINKRHALVSSKVTYLHVNWIAAKHMKKGYVYQHLYEIIICSKIVVELDIKPHVHQRSFRRFVVLII